MIDDEVIPQVRLRKLSELKLYERNSRTHSPEQIETLMSLIREFGFTNPMLVDENDVVAGHGRHAALSNLYALGTRVKLPNGRELPPFTVPTIDCSGWSEQQRRAYIIADNQSALRAGWDMDLLRDELTNLRDDGFDLALTAFTAEELEIIFEPQIPDRERDPDACPPEPKVPHTQEGDVWVLGPHRVICSDSTSPEAWTKLLGGELLDVVLTDPPYNVDLAEKNDMRDRADKGGRSKVAEIRNDKMSDADFLQLLRTAFSSLHAVMRPGAPIYIAHADREGLNFRKAFNDAGFKFSSMLIWKKDQFVLGRADHQSIHESLIYGYKPGAKHRWYGGRKQTSVIELGERSPFVQQPDGRWTFTVGDEVFVVDGAAKVEAVPGSIVFHEKPRRAAQHQSMKPVGLMEKLLRNSARAGHLVGDGFGGSGSTLIAADRLGMVARVIELAPGFVDVIVMRWQNLTGRVAVHAETGLPFPVAPDVSQAF